jgi:hypothetical protein
VAGVAALAVLLAGGPLAAVGVFGSVAAAQPDDRQQETAMAQTVLDQLAAFRRGDWPGAYAFASASIQERYTLEAFREMVTRGYRPIAQPMQSRVLKALALDSQRGFVELRVEARDGDTIDALYELILEQGRWRINGVIARPVATGDLVLGGSSAPSGPTVG